MSAGDTLASLVAQRGLAPDADPAELDVLAGAGDQIVPVWDFDPGSTEESVDFPGIMPEHYGQGGVTLTLGLTCEATSGNVVMSAAFKRLQAGENPTSKAFASQNDSAATAVNGTARVLFEVTITFTNGADMDSVDVGDYYALRITRSSADAGDTVNSNDIELHYVRVEET